MIAWFGAALAALQGPGGPGGTAAPASASAEAPWHDAAGLKRTLDELTGPHAARSRVTSYGKSRGGRDLWCVELGAVDDAQRARKPALLVVAGLDGQHLVGTEVALDTLKRLLAADADAAAKKLLDEHVVYLIPRANPDGAEAWFHPPGAAGAASGAKREVRGNLTPVDDDRDGAIDEDPPQDLDGDGFITQMRWKDPAGTWIADPTDARALKSADPLKGERGVFKVAPEGVDRDGDGEFGEDGAGDVAPARNFPQRWSEFDPTAGRVPMGEPETLALGQFLFDRPAIALVVVYGLQDNIAVDAKQDAGGEGGGGPGPGGGGGGAGGGGGGGGGGFRFSRTLPTGIVKDDQGLFGELATRYREATGVTSKPLSESDDGAFWTFSYFQFGVPTLAIHLWSPPLDLKKPEEKKAEDGKEGADANKAADGAAAGQAAPADAPKPEAPKSDAPKQEEPKPKPEEPKPAAEPAKSETPPAEGGGPGGRGGRGRGFGRGGGGGAGEGGGGDAKKSEGDDLKLLLWNDQKMEGAAFVPWKTVKHPTLGEVEVGGFKPYVRSNPPAAELAELAKKHTDFTIALGGLFAKLVIEEPKVEDLGGGVWRVTTAVVNEGWLPSVCSMGERCRRPRPTRLDLAPGAAKLVQGEKRHTWTRIEGSGGRREVKWLLQADPGATLTLELWSEKGGDAERVVTLR